ncbi:MAG: hypothetical protein ISS23_00970 [Nanoarchaeota archaeon]|nr:hypothetical protein [Nanoarchaeota archaeon]
MGILDDIKEGLDDFKEELTDIKAGFHEKIDDLVKNYDLAKEEKGKVLGMGPEQYVQYMRENPEIYGGINEDNFGLLARLASDIQHNLEFQVKAEDRQDKFEKAMASLGYGMIKEILPLAGIEVRMLKNQDKDANKSEIIKGIKKAYKI